MQKSNLYCHPVFWNFEYTFEFFSCLHYCNSFMEVAGKLFKPQSHRPSDSLATTREERMFSNPLAETSLRLPSLPIACMEYTKVCNKSNTSWRKRPFTLKVNMLAAALRNSFYIKRWMFSISGFSTAQWEVCMCLQTGGNLPWKLQTNMEVC